VVLEVAASPGELAGVKELAEHLLGTTLQAGYRLVETLATGGMARVYRAERDGSAAVAVKVMHRSLVGDPVHRWRFLQEARVMQSVRHPAVVPVLESGETGDGQPFLVMELLGGENAGDLLAREGALPWRRAASIAGQLAVALDQVHRAGFLHRDLKPDNVMLRVAADGGEQVTLLDFGMARPLDADDAPPVAVAGAAVPARPGRPVTDPGIVCGTPEYMGPEQVDGRPDIDGRADVYGLGALLYHLVTGTPPFVAERPTDVLLLQLHHLPEPPSRRAPERGLPPELDALLLRALAKRREDRFATARELWAALQALPLAGR
jgi:serine/threonine-protein kinase